jgi:hypothetical protein
LLTKGPENAPAVGRSGSGAHGLICIPTLKQRRGRAAGCRAQYRPPVNANAANGSTTHSAQEIPQRGPAALGHIACKLRRSANGPAADGRHRRQTFRNETDPLGALNALQNATALGEDARNQTGSCRSISGQNPSQSS